MSDFDEKLNSLLSDPAAMSQIMQLAQTLGGSAASAAPASQPEAASSGDAQASPPSGAPDPQLLAHLLPLLRQLNSQQDSNARTLLLAMRPYLKKERQDKVERAIQLARLIHAGKTFLAGWGK